MAFALTFVGTWPADLRDAGERVLASLQQHIDDLPSGTINVKLVDDTESLRLNKEYNGNAYATDVLTFHYAEGDTAIEELADIAISQETAARQATTAGTDFADEIGLLICHGVLHALGHDHQTEDEQKQIARLQQQIVEDADLTYREFTWDE